MPDDPILRLTILRQTRIISHHRPGYQRKQMSQYTIYCEVVYENVDPLHQYLPLSTSLPPTSFYRPVSTLPRSTKTISILRNLKPPALQQYLAAPILRREGSTVWHSSHFDKNPIPLLCQSASETAVTAVSDMAVVNPHRVQSQDLHPVVIRISRTFNMSESSGASPLVEMHLSMDKG